MKVESVLGFPWENGAKPYFVNDEGFEWYIDKDFTQEARTGKGKRLDLLCNYVKKGKRVDFVLVNDKNEIMYATKDRLEMYDIIQYYKLEKATRRS